MNPLCTLRYSATHADKHHMLYRLDAVDAYERKLVKQIEVASLRWKAATTRPMCKLLSSQQQNGHLQRQVELDVQHGTRVRRETVTG